jgi:ABC-type glycerol-3-phosphate transport system substrate-binding protein
VNFRLVLSVLIVLALIAVFASLSGCVGAVQDYATTAQGFATEATNNTITGWQAADDNELRALAAA